MADLLVYGIQNDIKHGLKELAWMVKAQREVEKGNARSRLMLYNPDIQRRWINSALPAFERALAELENEYGDARLANRLGGIVSIIDDLIDRSFSAKELGQLRTKIVSTTKKFMMLDS